MNVFHLVVLWKDLQISEQDINCNVCLFFVWPKAFFICVYTIFPLGVLYPKHLQLAFDCVVIACSLESIRPGLVQGCKAPNGVG